MTAPVPRRRLRTRLALLHAALAFAGSVVLLALVDLPLFSGSSTVHNQGGGAVRTTSNLPEVLRYSAVALALLAAVSVVLGWFVAGRALRPLHALTRSARTMSADDLNNRPPVRAGYREFAELADTLDDLMRRLDASFTAQRQFVANASHELRTPLTAQRTLLQVTLADPDATAGTLRSTCHEVLALGEQQEELIEALLTLAGGYQGFDRWERLDLAELTRAAIRADAGLDVRVRSTLTPTAAFGDARLAASLITNLIDNAVRHNVPGGTVEVLTTPPGRLVVGNTGAVIPPSELNRLFQPFQRLGTDRTDRTRGHGLGLAIVAAIAHAHHAALAASPRPGGGLQVTVDFPTAPPGH